MHSSSLEDDSERDGRDLLLMNAHHVLGDGRLAFRVDEHSVEVFDCTKTVAAKTEVVGSTASTGVTKVKSLFALERRARISIGNGHLGEGEAIENISTIILDIVEDSTLTGSESNSEAPFLPFDERIV